MFADEDFKKIFSTSKRPNEKIIELIDEVFEEKPKPSASFRQTYLKVKIEKFYRDNTPHYEPKLRYSNWQLNFILPDDAPVNNLVFKAIFCIANAKSKKEESEALEFLDSYVAGGKKIDIEKRMFCFCPVAQGEGYVGGTILESCEIDFLHFIFGGTGARIDFETKCQLIKNLYELGADFNFVPRYLQGRMVYPGLSRIDNLTPLEFLLTSVMYSDSVVDKENIVALAALLIECGADKSRSGIEYNGFLLGGGSAI